MKRILFYSKYPISGEAIYLFLILSIISVTQFSCSKQSDVIPQAPVSNPITNTSLSGFIKGTLLAGTTYTVYDDIYVKSTDTLAVQPGVTVIIESNGDPNGAGFKSIAIHNSGTLLIEGTKENPITFKPSAPNPEWPNGYWGGIQSDSSAKYVKMTWTNISYTGGADIAGGAQYAFSVRGVSNSGGFTSSTSVIVENCKFTSGIDDCIRLMGPIKVSIKGNVILHQGSNDGDNINIKNGVTGDVAYNYIWSAANNSIKLNTNATVLFPQTNVNIYNNTMISGGWRKQGEITAGILVDVFAKGSVYNNLIINCHAGVRITAAADTAQMRGKYGYNYFYTSPDFSTKLDSTKMNYYPATEWAKATSTDFVSGIDPMITNLNVSDAEFSIDQTPLVVSDLNNPHLKTGSPVIGKGNTNAPYHSDLGTVMAPGKDIGAFQTDGSGNQY